MLLSAGHIACKKKRIFSVSVCAGIVSRSACPDKVGGFSFQTGTCATEGGDMSSVETAIAVVVKFLKAFAHEFQENCNLFMLIILFIIINIIFCQKNGEKKDKQ